MAITDLIFATGLETGDLRVMDLQQGGLITTDVTRHPDSLYSMRAGGTGGMGFFNVASVPATSEIFVSFGVYWNDASLPTADGSQDGMFQFSETLGASEAGTHIIITPDSGFLAAYRGRAVGGQPDTQLALSAIPFSPQVWYYLEIYMLIADAGGRVVVRQNDTEILNFTGDTRDGSTGVGNRLGWGTPQHFRIDDIVCRNVSGVPVTWPGDKKLVGIVPNGIGDFTEWNRGGADSGNNWSQVEERPPTNDTDYVTTAALNQRDLYTFGDVDAAFHTIDAIVSWLLARKDDAGSASVAHLLKSGVTLDTGADLSLSTTYQYLDRFYETDPDTGAAWTLGAVNAVQAGPKSR